MQQSNGPQKFEMILLYLAISGFSGGIVYQESLFILFMLVQIGFALFAGRRFGSLYGDGHQAGFIFFSVLLVTSAIAASRFDSPDPTRIHWAFTAFWAVSILVVAKIDWVLLHRMLIIFSVPGLLFSVGWMLQPEELAWSMKVGFGSYPRAHGFTSNAITFSEGMVVIGAWTLSRLQTGLSKRERQLLVAHLILSILIVYFSRVRSGMLGFLILFLLFGLASKQYRRRAIIAVVTMIATFVLIIGIFGFNIASIDKRLQFMERGVDIVRMSPWVGVGPNRFFETDIANPEGLEEVAHPHNTILAITAEAGIFGLIAYLAFIGMLGWQLIQLWRAHVSNESELAWVVRTLAFVFILYCSFGLFDYNFADTELVILHGFHWSIIAALATRLKRAQTTAEAPA